MELYHVSHIDLDGIGCQVVASHAEDPASYRRINVDYGDLREAVEDTAASLAAEDTLLITDLSLRDDEEGRALVERLDKGPFKVIWLDHHQTTLPFSSKYGWVRVDTSMCATMLTLSHFRDRLPTPALPALEQFAALVNDYDLWLHRDPRSERLNMLHYAWGHDLFFSRFSSYPMVAETPEETAVIDVLLRMRQEYVERAAAAACRLQDDEGRPYASVFAEDHISLLGSRLLELHDDVLYAQIINAQRGTVSLRARKGQFNVGVLAEQHGGGGHAAAAGYSIHASQGALFEAAHVARAHHPSN